jgi:hypothetical protein
MAVSPEIIDLIQKFDTATTAVSDRIDRLIAEIQAGTLTDQAEIVARLQPIADHLDALGKDPAKPFPALGTKR